MAGIPVATYSYNSATPGQPAVTFNMNGETVDFIPMMPSHTAGDTIVRFRKANVIYIEDFYRNFGYPFADQANGGSIKGMLDAVDLIQKLADPENDADPRPRHARQEAGSAALSRDARGGHGQGQNDARSGQVAERRSRGESDRAVRQDDVRGYQQSKDRFITEVYDEVKDFPPVVDGKRTMPVHQ